MVCKDRGGVARMLAAKCSHGVLRYSQLDAATLTDPDLAQGQHGDLIINVNELLPSAVLKLLTEAKAQLKPAGFKYVWCRNTTVFAKHSDRALVQIINTPADLPRIIQLYSVPGPVQL